MAASAAGPGDLLVLAWRRREAEERGREEVAGFAGRSVLPEGVPVRHPAFDVTPAELVDGIVTEQGVARPPYRESLRRAVEAADAGRGA